VQVNDELVTVTVNLPENIIPETVIEPETWALLPIAQLYVAEQPSALVCGEQSSPASFDEDDELNIEGLSSGHRASDPGTFVIDVKLGLLLLLRNGHMPPADASPVPTVPAELLLHPPTARVIVAMVRTAHAFKLSIGDPPSTRQTTDTASTDVATRPGSSRIGGTTNFDKLRRRTSNQPLVARDVAQFYTLHCHWGDLRRRVPPHNSAPLEIGA
jgi:hypothetical protein